MIKITGKTDIGLVREKNEDAFMILALGQSAGLAFVCDGMGGEHGGDIASTIARDEITAFIQTEFFDEMSEQQLQDLITAAIGRANDAICRRAGSDPLLTGMGTTVVLTLVSGTRILAANVGDSRLYLFRDNVLTQLTRDHSFVQDLVERGTITQEEADVHPQKNMITRALGIGRELTIDFLSLDLMQGDKLLLCSDGLTNLCSKETIAGVLKHSGDEAAVEALISSANDGGGHDNITVIIMENEAQA